MTKLDENWKLRPASHGAVALPSYQPRPASHGRVTLALSLTLTLSLSLTLTLTLTSHGTVSQP